MEKLTILGREAICVTDALCGDLCWFCWIGGDGDRERVSRKDLRFMVVLLSLWAAGQEKAPIWWLVGMFGLDRVDER